MTVGACRHAGRALADAVLGMVLALSFLNTTGTAAMAGASDPADAATAFNEADLPGREFSADYRAPTRVPAGVDRVIGTGSIGSDDYLRFDLAPGAQRVVLEFHAPEAVDYSYSAGGVVLFDTRAFAFEWAGTQLPVPIRLDHRRRQQSMTITLPESFGGRLFLALNFTHGEDIAYALSITGNVPVLTTVGTVRAWPHG